MISSIILSVIVIILLFHKEQRKLRKTKEEKQIEDFNRTDSKWLKTQMRLLIREKYKEKSKLCNLRKIK